MKVRQYAYLSFKSDLVDPGTISERAGLMPSEVELRGSRHAGPPPLPRCHLWKMVSGVDDKARLDDHFEALLAKLSGSAPRVRSLLLAGDVSGTIQVVRYFEPGAEADNIVQEGRLSGDLVRLGGQHPLVGFDLAPELIAYVAETGMGIDFDEYGSEDE